MVSTSRAAHGTLRVLVAKYAHRDDNELTRLEARQKIVSQKSAGARYIGVFDSPASSCRFVSVVQELAIRLLFSSVPPF